MKKLAFALLFLLSFSAYSKGITTPFWHSISEKILTGTHQLISPEETPQPQPAKPKAKVKAKPETTPLKCTPKKENNVLPTTFFTIKSDGMWIASVD